MFSLRKHDTTKGKTSAARTSSFQALKDDAVSNDSRIVAKAARCFSQLAATSTPSEEAERSDLRVFRVRAFGASRGCSVCVIAYST